MDRLLPLELNGQQSEEVSETKFLGVVLDSGLTWKAHIQHVRNKVSSVAGIKKKLRPYVNNDVYLSIFHLLVLEHLL